MWSNSTRRNEGLAVYLMITLALLLMFAPVITMLVFSFNAPGGRFNYVLGSFSLQAWASPFAVPQLSTAVSNSLLVAVASSVLAGLLGTPIGFILGRSQFRGKVALSTLTFIPLATPEVVLGAGMLALFVASGSIPLLKSLSGGLFYPLGLPSVIVAHTTLGLSFVIINVRARVITSGLSLEQAARDLGAEGFTLFTSIWLPMIAPGIVAGMLLVFAISLDDFVLTNFTAGSATLFPTWLYGLMRRELPPQIAVIGSLIFLLSLVSVALSVKLSQSLSD